MLAGIVRVAFLTPVAITLSLLKPTGLVESELSVEDFDFYGPLGSDGAKIIKLQTNHFQVTLHHAAEHPNWANNCQFRIKQNAKGVDMNRSYLVDGADAEKQAHEAYVYQKDLEQIMASESPITTAWSMHTWGGMVDPILLPGPEMGTTLALKEAFRDILNKNDPNDLVEELRFQKTRHQHTWTGGPHKQFGITSILCEGAGSIFTKQTNLESGTLIMKSIDAYYRGVRPVRSTESGENPPPSRLDKLLV